MYFQRSDTQHTVCHFYPGHSKRIGELDYLPLRDGEADFICINLVLHHLSRPSTSLGEIARVLHPGGLVLVTDFDQHSQESMRTMYGDRWLGFLSP